MHRSAQIRPIMIIEDSDDDFEATERAFREGSAATHPILRFESGHEAMAYLESVASGASPDEDHVMPAIILLDLNLPGMNGREVLARIRQNELLGHLPVIVLTMSANQSDIDECYRLGANTYIVKPLGLDEFYAVIDAFKNYWLDIALLPDRVNR